MRLVVLISGDSVIQGVIAGLFPDDFQLVVCSGHFSGQAVLKDVTRGVVLVDTAWREAKSWLAKMAGKNPGLVFAGVGKDKEKYLQFNDYLYDYLEIPFQEWQLAKLLEKAWEKTAPTLHDILPLTAPGPWPAEEVLIDTPRPWSRILSEFSKAMRNQFNKERFLELFLDAVRELVPVGKMAILLKTATEERYSVRVQKGLDPDLMKQLKFRAEGGMVSWFVDHGAILFREEATGWQKKYGGSDLLQEMRLLNAQVCLPLFVHNNLVGILALGKKITGDVFSKQELELLYTICENVASVLNDLDWHERILKQKVYTESVLQLMDSGIVAIDTGHFITIFNEQAAQILTQETSDILGSDLRVLPSPLGDMLFESLSAGARYFKEEVLVGKDKIPLEVSTYRVTESTGFVLGSVMIFDDIRARKTKEASKLKEEQLKMLNSFAGQLAHEINNPVVAVRTFSELLPEKYTDHNFLHSFSSVIGQEVERLSDLAARLTSFSAPPPHHLVGTRANELLDQAAARLLGEAQGEGLTIDKKYCPGDYKVRADQESLSRALFYLLRYFAPEEARPKRLLIKTACPRGRSSKALHILITDGQTVLSAEQLSQLFCPLAGLSKGASLLALPASKKIIEEHGGQLRVAQKKGGYLKFGVILPILEEDR